MHSVCVWLGSPESPDRAGAPSAQTSLLGLPLKHLPSHQRLVLNLRLEGLLGLCLSWCGGGAAKNYENQDLIKTATPERAIAHHYHR
eukprot:3661498-Amphidinium_carterae.1